MFLIKDFFHFKKRKLIKENKKIKNFKVKWGLFCKILPSNRTSKNNISKSIYANEESFSKSGNKINELSLNKTKTSSFRYFK